MSKDRLVKEVEEHVNITPNDGVHASEPPGRPRVETAAALSSISSVLKALIKIHKDHEDSPRTITSLFNCMDILQEDTISATDDPYKYWGINCQQFPGFGAAAAAALKCLHVFRTSVVSVLGLSTAKTFSISQSYWSGIYPRAFCPFWW